jgi:predicted amidohydrolase
MPSLRIAAIQSDIVWEDPQANFEHLRPWIRAATTAGAGLVVLPEMYACGFSMNTEAIREPEDGPSTAFLVEQAREHQIHVCGSIPELQSGHERPHNTLVLAAPDGGLTRYHKIHPFSYAREHEHYEAGSEFVTATVEGVRLSLFVCYDLRFADEFWVRARETDAYVVVANWPAPRREHWRALLRARAIENQAYVIGVNRVGGGGKLEYLGDSAIIDPLGIALAEGSSGETMLLGDIDPERVASVRAKFPFMNDRR